MAASQSATQSSSAEFRQAQAGLVVALEADVAQSYANDLDVSQLRKTMPLFKRAMQALARHYGLAMGALSADFYSERRDQAGITTALRLPAPNPPNAGALDTGIDWATRVLWRAEPDVATGLTNAQGVMDKAALDVGRSSVLDSVKSDRKAIGWARETKPKPCYFCALLATRGAVYKSEETADFQAHNSCQCFAVPVFTSYEPSAQIREFQALYKQYPGLNNFRRHYEAHYGL